MIVATIFRRTMTAVCFLFVALGTVNGGGESIKVECPVCAREIFLQPPDLNMPFVLLHGELKYGHGVCWECALRLCASASARMRCPICDVVVDDDVRRNICVGRERCNEVNATYMASVKVQQWEEIRRLLHNRGYHDRVLPELSRGQRVAEKATIPYGRDEQAIVGGTVPCESEEPFGSVRREDFEAMIRRSSACINGIPIRPGDEPPENPHREGTDLRASPANIYKGISAISEAEMQQGDREDAERRVREKGRRIWVGGPSSSEEEARDAVHCDDTHRRVEEERRRAQEQEERIRCDTERRRTIRDERRRDAWTRTTQPSFIRKHRVTVGICVACIVIAAFTVWRASHDDGDDAYLKDKQYPLVARLRARLGKFCPL